MKFSDWFRSAILISLPITGLILTQPVIGNYENSPGIQSGSQMIDTVCFVTSDFNQENFILSSSGISAPLIISPEDYPGVIRALRDLQTDIGKVTGAAPPVVMATDLINRHPIDNLPGANHIVIAGTIGSSSLIGELIKNQKIDVSQISGKWESFLIEVVQDPVPGIEKALVIAGSDKRGTIYGIYEISGQIGVSPWYWWGDVPVSHNPDLYIVPGRYTYGEPSVKYRGLFLNDEAPALTNWVAAKYGMVPLSEDPPTHEGIANYGREFYTKLFELILRIRGNYLWPAMWNNAFNEDDPENPRLADEYGIVMGTSHQEPMLRAQKEWDRRHLNTLGRWNYVTHKEILEEFWREGIRRNKNYESIITIGLRGANDTEMMPGGPEVNIPFLEKIVDVQRKMIADEIHPDVTKIPQMWCLYKEVQDYYVAGLRVPDDVTLLWAEDNWGNIRRLPTREERDRSGGAGIYYHFDYHGGPRSYQWLNTNPIPKIWDQMSLAKQYGADRIWIVNAGHFKGYEFPLEYFMRLGWNTGLFRNDNIDEYTRWWSQKQFGPEYADEIAGIISKYTKFNGRRKPELLSPETYSLVNYNEAEKIVSDYNAVVAGAEEIYGKLEPEKRDAFYQLVLFPAKACALVNELYITAGKNYLYAKQGRASTNDMAAKTELLFRADTSLMGYFNRSFAGGKWNHFMDQAHLGYTGWADPPFNSLRAIDLKKMDFPEKAIMGVAIEGSENVWPGAGGKATLPEFDVFNRQEHWIEFFNKGSIPFKVRVKTKCPWIRIKGAGTKVTVGFKAFNPDYLTPQSLQGFVEGEGFVSMEAEHFTKNTESGQSCWMRIEDYGHTLSGMRATAPVDAPPALPGNNSPCLEYQMFLFSTGTMEVKTVFSPTLNFMPGRGLHYAISFDDNDPQIVTLVPDDFNAQNGNRDWEKTVMDNARFSTTSHVIREPGYHTLKIWMIDPGPVLQKIVVNTGGVKSSYLGPPESYFNLNYEKLTRD